MKHYTTMSAAIRKAQPGDTVNREFWGRPSVVGVVIAVREPDYAAAQAECDRNGWEWTMRSAASVRRYKRAIVVRTDGPSPAYAMFSAYGQSETFYGSAYTSDEIINYFASDGELVRR